MSTATDMATGLANDLVALKKNSQTNNAFDGTLRQILTQVMVANEKEGVFEQWATAAEPKLRDLGTTLAASEQMVAERNATIIERDATIAEKDAEIARLTAEIARLTAQADPVIFEITKDGLEYPDDAISGRDQIIGKYPHPIREDMNNAG